MTIPVTPGQLPSGFCPATYQQLLNAFSAVQSVDVGASSGIQVVASASKPTDTTVIWQRLDQFGRPDRIYWFASGAWLSLHPLVPGLTQWWFDVLPNFATFDGGDALAPSVLSGPMWQKAKNSDGIEIAAKFPIAAGTLASGTVLNQGDTGGEDQHVLTLTEIPAHTHTVPLYQGNSVNHADRINTTDEITAQNLTYQSGSAGGKADGTTAAHQNMPPYVVGYLLQRTSRLFYAIT